MAEVVHKVLPLLLLVSRIDAGGIGKAWQVLPYATGHWNHPSWPRLDTSAFEVRSVSGVGRLASHEPQEKTEKTENPVDPNSILASNAAEATETIRSFEPIPRDLPYDDLRETVARSEDPTVLQKVLTPRTMILQPSNTRGSLSEPVPKDQATETVPRVRRDADNDTKLEQISTNKNVREVRLTSPDSWSSQPISVEFPQRSSLDQVIQRPSAEDDSPILRNYQAPRADFVTAQHRRSYEHREARDMPVTRGYEDYDFPWYRNSVRDRDYDPLLYRRGYSYYYPDRYRMERDYYSPRLPNDYSYYYDRYRDEDMDLYGRSRPVPKPKRIIYYATLPEVVRKPVDMRNYPRPYDGARSPVSRDGSFKRIPGNVDPGRYRYRHLYDGYDSYSKRSSYGERPYEYPEEDGKRSRVTLESFRNGEAFDPSNERKLVNQVPARNEGKLPWPVQVGTEVSVKEDDRITGRKIFGDSDGFERFQNAQMQKAPDATGSSELRSDN